MPTGAVGIENEIIVVKIVSTPDRADAKGRRMLLRDKLIPNSETCKQRLDGRRQRFANADAAIIRTFNDKG